MPVAGAVFKLTPPTGGITSPWTEKVLYTFTGRADGGSPTGELVMDRQGGLYGTTYYGGLGNASKKAQQHGVVYKLTPPAVANGVWHEKVLYKFKGGTDGTNPAAGLLRSASGVLYGTTVKGGTAGLGTVFALTPPKAGATAWTHTVLHSFIGGSDGASPEGALIADSNGALYGETSAGGLTAAGCSNGCGTVYKILP